MKAAFSIAMIGGCLGLVSFYGCSSPDENANKLFVEASQLVQKAQETEGMSYSDAFELYNDALTRLEKITSKYPSSQLAVNLAQGNLKIGTYTITDFKESVVRQAKIKADAEGDFLACAFFLTTKIDGSPSNKSRMLIEIANTYTEIGKYDKAFEVTKIIDNASLKAEPLSKIVNKCIEIGQYDKAFEVTKAIDDASRKEQLFSGMIGNFIEAGQYDKALTVGQKMIEERIGIESIQEPQGLLALLYAIDGQYTKALDILKKIDNKSLESEVFTEVVRTHAKAGKYNQAIEAIKYIGDARDKTKAFINVAIRADSAHKDIAFKMLSHAVEHASKIDDTTAQIYVLVNVTKTYMEIGHKNEAVETLSHILNIAQRIKEPSENANIFNSIAAIYMLDGQNNTASEMLSRAFEFTKSVSNVSVESNLLHSIADSYTKIGQFDQAIDVSKRMKNLSKNFALSQIAEKSAQAGNFDKALTAARAIDDASFRNNALNKISCEYAKSGKYDKALELAKTLNENSSALSCIAEKYSETGQCDNAFKITRVVGSKLGWGKAIRVSLMVKVAEECIKHGEYEVAFEIAKTIEDNYYAAQVAGKLTEVGQYNKAIGIAGQRNTTDSRAIVLANIVKSCAETNQNDKALDALQLIESVSVKAGAMIDLADKYSRANHKEKASEMLFRALESTPEIQKTIDQAYALVSIASGFSKSGQKVDDEIRKILHILIKRQHSQ